MPETIAIPDINDIHSAQQRTRNQIRITPVLNEPGLDADLGCRLYCKCEHLQRTGSFKFRGASNAVARLREAHIDGDLATHSSGNHGAALSLAARLDGRTAHVVMPENASPIKIVAVKRFGGRIHYCAPTQAAREAGLATLVGDGFIPIPPYDHFDIIAGQGTAALELLQSGPGLDMLIAPVGGGGLVSGTALAAKDRDLAVFAAEPAGAADTATSIAQGRRVESWQPDTIADGLRALVGIRNFAIIQHHVTQVLTVTDDEIRDAMGLFWLHLRMLIEPSSAVVIAAVRKHPEFFSGRRVGAIISGANIEPADWVSLVEAKK
jgi:threonine dehydratase